MEALLQTDYVERALSSYSRVCPHAPQPSRAYSYATRYSDPHYGEQHYIVLGSELAVLAVYRIRRRGALWLMVRWPKALDHQHRQRMRHAHRASA
jgi:hypothetical protein